MESRLQILHLEDDQADAGLVRSTLEGGGISCAITLVQGREEFVAALERGGIDLILSDYTLPAFDGLSAAGIVRTRWPAIPLIFVSSTLGEERAIESLKSGAADYVLKERLARLVPAVRRALRDAADQAAHRSLEAQLIEAQKMEVIGQLAGGVAHDFNNLLAVIMGYTDMIATELAADSHLRRYAEEIRHASERAAGLTRQLLVFSRRQTVKSVVLDINEVVRSAETMLGRLIDGRIELAIVLGKRIGRVRSDPGYIGQVLMNLVVNARDAMPKGGKLTIATDNATLDEAYARAHKGAVPGKYVTLSVGDTGTGITDEVKARLFEPFFTTKTSRKGTGLGLAICKTIVEQGGGHIAVYSELGRGTTFVIHFPRVDQPLHVASWVDPKGPMPRGTETILVVEDEPAVRRLACGVLKDLGYEVLSASNGQDGLNAAREHKDSPIHLVITDVIMPMMGGKVMAEWLKATFPDLKVLFTSGYMDDTVRQQGVYATKVEFLQKPYTPATLAHKVRLMLDGVTAAPREAKKDPAGAGPSSA